MKNAITILGQRVILLTYAAGLALTALRGDAQPPPGPALNAEAPGQNLAEAPAQVSPAVGEVLRLAESGVGEDVVMAYIQNSSSPFDLSADQILYVKDVGLSSSLITAMLNRDATLRNQPQPTQPPAGPAAPAAPVEAPLTPPPVQTATPPVQVNYFYSDLSPYGTWVDLEGVGWCWQPSVVSINRSWRPYCDGGHWTYTDAGWFWQSDYSWGWAPFHYGRWQMHPRCGWVWTPDTVWAPAWVVWRSSGDYCGWAPLPPRAVFEAGFGWRFNGIRVGVNFDFGLHSDHFTFVGLRDFNERDLHHRRLGRGDVTRVYNRTTIINNYTVNNNTIVNRGIEVDRVASTARTPVRRASVRELPAGTARTRLTAQAAESGANVVYKPQLKAPERSAPVVVQKVNERHPVIQHTPSVPVAGQPRRSVFDAGGRGSAATTPSIGARRAQPEVGKPAPRQNLERPTTSTPNQAVPTVRPAPPRNREPDPRTESPARSFQAPPASAQPAPATPAPPARIPPAQDPRPPGRVTNPNRPERASAVSPAEAPGQAPITQTQPRSVPGQQSGRSYGGSPPEARSGGNPHTYLPKGYSPAEERRSAAPAPRQAAPEAKRENPRSQSKKND